MKLPCLKIAAQSGPRRNRIILRQETEFPVFRRIVWLDVFGGHFVGGNDDPMIDVQVVVARLDWA